MNDTRNPHENAEKKNHLAGTIGAILGAIIGSIPWAIALYFGWFVGWLGFVIGFCAKKGYELLGGKKGTFKIVIVCLATIFGVIVGNTAWDLIEFGLLISSGEIVGATYSDIPALYFEWIKYPEVFRSILTNLLMGFLFAVLGVWSMFKEMIKDLKAPKGEDTIEEIASVTDSQDTEA